MGFYSVASAAVIELALKEIVTSFAAVNNTLFGEYVSAKYEQINGRVKIHHILTDHLGPFGEHYQKRFEKLLSRVNESQLKRRRFAVISSYGNLLTCRHKFAHEGAVPSSASYADVKRGFEASKIVLACLAKTLSK